MRPTDVPDDDRALHAGIIAGQHEALEEWEARYRARMLAAGRHAGLSLEDAEEAWFGEAVLAIWQGASRIRPLGFGLKKYAFGVMRMQARSRRREAQAASASLDGMAERGVAVRLPTATAMPDQRRQAVLRCLESLRPAERVLVELLYMNRVDPEVVAEARGVKTLSVRRAGERARERIRPCLEEALNVEA